MLMILTEIQLMIQLLLALPLPVLVTKTSTLTDNNPNGVTDLGDALVYNITVQNKGNVIIRGIAIQDTPTDGNGNPLSLISTPTYISSSAGPLSQGHLQ